MDKKRELTKLINESGIEPADKKEWEALISAAPEEYADGLLTLFTKFPDEIGWFTDVYKRKKRAFSVMREDKAKGEAIFEEIVKEEKEKLDKIS